MADPETYPTVLFSVAELQAFSSKVQDSSRFTAEEITAAEAYVRRRFEKACRVAFVATTETDERHDGSGTDVLRLDHLMPFEVTEISIGGTTFTEAQLADVVPYRGGFLIRAQLGVFTAGRGNVLVTYNHGYTAVPDDIHREAMVYAVDRLVSTRISDRTRSFSDESGTYSYSWAGQAPHWTGIDSVDAVLADYQPAGIIA